MILISLVLLQATAAPPTYVFFDWGKVEITRDSAAALDGIAEGLGAGARIEIVGHSDRSGSVWSNLLSSRKRALAVRNYLTGKGVAGDAITVSGVGETEPIIPTQDGVREVQNRRVEIRVIAP
jgi:outer membrane protein OmpA-like peptidoglycan-associated protein